MGAYRAWLQRVSWQGFIRAGFIGVLAMHIRAPFKRLWLGGAMQLSGWARRYISELIYGANDGLITTFAVVAGVAGASIEDRVVMILGFANLLADGFSMAASNYLSARSKDPSLPTWRVVKSSMATFGAFVLVGAVPLLAFLSPLFSTHRFSLTTFFTLLTLFVVGALRVRVTQRGWLRSGCEMLLVGSIAATVAYAIGLFLSGLVAGASPGKP